MLQFNLSGLLSGISEHGFFENGQTVIGDHASPQAPEVRGANKVISYIEDPVIIANIYSHLNEKKSVVAPDFLAEDRPPPQLGLFDG